MKMHVIRWAAIGLMILSLVFLVSSPALAEIIELPLDQTAAGEPWTEENWILIPGEEALQDERVLAFGTAQTKC